MISFGIMGGLNYEMYADQFHESSVLPYGGEIVSSGYSFGFSISYDPVDLLEMFINGRIRKVDMLIGRQGEQLKGWTYQGGWRSDPLPYDIYYHLLSTMFQLGVEIVVGSDKSFTKTYLGASFNFGSFMMNLGSKDNSVAYSDAYSDMSLGYSIVFGLGFPIRSQKDIICIPIFFVESGGLFPSNPVKITNYIWEGITYELEEQPFGLSGILVGLGLKAPFSF